MRDEVINELIRRELARRYYAHYLPYVNGSAWIDTKMSRFIAEKVQTFIEADSGHAYDILIIETPPQHGKSMTVSESLASWYLGKHPEANIIMASYDSEFAERFCRRNKEKIKRCGAALFGIGIGGIDRTTEFELSNGKGRLISRGIMSGITGNPANLIIIDDPIKNREEADSTTRRDKLWEEWQATLKSRLCAGGKVIVILTPWHEDDLAARLMNVEPNVELLRLPVEAGENDPLGRAPGDSLCPELGKDRKWLEDFKAAYVSDPKGGLRSWTSLYMCRPRTEEGNLVKRGWWRYYDEPPAFDSQLISVDAAFKGNDSNDFVSIQVWGRKENDCFLLHCENTHYNFPETVAAIRRTAKMYPAAKTVLIEDAANGPAVIETLQREFFCIPVRSSDSKESRVNGVSAAIESGHVYLPRYGSEEFIEQFAAFPNAAHDDIVDAASQALKYLVYRGAPKADYSGGFNFKNFFKVYK